VLGSVVIEAVEPERAFTTARSSKAAQQALVTDGELCEAIQEVGKGRADDVGGAVYKKRLNRNMRRCIILAKAAGTESTLTCLPEKIGMTTKMMTVPVFVR
jgi:hypothetical protein